LKEVARVSKEAGQNRRDANEDSQHYQEPREPKYEPEPKHIMNLVLQLKNMTEQFKKLCPGLEDVNIETAKEYALNRPKRGTEPILQCHPQGGSL